MQEEQPKRWQSELFVNCGTRIARANTHAARIADLWNEIPLFDLTEVESFIEDDGSGSIWLRPKESALPQELELEFGEYLYQLRAALDGAVYALPLRTQETIHRPIRQALNSPSAATVKSRASKSERSLR